MISLLAADIFVCLENGIIRVPFVHERTGRRVRSRGLSMDITKRFILSSWSLTAHSRTCVVFSAVVSLLVELTSSQSSTTQRRLP